MFRSVKKVFISLLSFGRSWATKCVSLNNKPCMIRLNLIDLTHFVLNYYPFMISLDKYRGSYNVADDLSMNIYVPRETKEVFKIWII